MISVLQNEGVYVQNLEQLRAVEEVRMKLGAAELRRQFKENMEALEQKSDDDDEEMPELATDSDDNDNAENEAKLESEQFHGKNE